jgi:hypothetical protein
MDMRRTEYELLAGAARLSIRVLTSEGAEEPDASWQALRCKIRRDDVDDGALALIFAIAALSFHDARPRGYSFEDFSESDEWTVSDLCTHLRFRSGVLMLDVDYLRGRMVKTTISVRTTGVVEIRTVNRHQMASRWLDALKGRKHLRLVGALIQEHSSRGNVAPGIDPGDDADGSTKSNPEAPTESSTENP